MSQPKRFIVAVDPQGPVAGLEAPVLAIGNFDGVHRGHAAVVGRARELARKLARPCAVLTFEPHPADFFSKKPVVFRLTSLDAKARKLAALGVDGLVALRFDEKLADLSAEDFVADVLLRRLGARAIVVGYDFHYGRGRAGTPQTLREAGREKGFQVEIVEKIAADAAGSLDAASSTAVRAALQAGDVARASHILGAPFSVEGEVVHGRKLGRTLGFPTANIALGPAFKLRHGIYAVRFRVEGRQYGGVANFGSRPTVDNGPPLLEVFVFDFAGDLYGKTVEVDFIAFLRPEEKFDGLDALTVQMRKDEAEARKILAVSAEA
jgi:riboflavin kinase/FMN adenylyltransferase